MSKADDNLSREGAELLAESIRRYWAKQGFSIECRIESYRLSKTKTIFSVRSGLVNGMPAGDRALRAVAAADSGGSRPRIRDDVAHHSDLISLGVPR
jgi:hypothetical protein